MAERVSVIIPVYNAALYIAEAIETVLDQTLKPHEIIVVDDGSTDGSGEIAARYGVTLLRQENSGVSDARNRGVQHATGDYFAFLDADDMWMPTKLEDQLQGLQEHPEAGYALAYMRHLFEGDERPDWFKRTSALSEEPGFGPGLWLIRRSVWIAVGPFEAGTRAGEDIDWLTRANDRGIKFHMIPKVLMLRRVHKGNLTGKPELVQDWLRVLRASAGRKRAMGQT